MAEQKGQPRQAPPPQHTLLAVLREAFQPTPAPDGLEERFNTPSSLAHPREIFAAQIKI